MNITSSQWQAGAMLLMSILSVLTTLQLFRFITVPAKESWEQLPPMHFYTFQDDDYAPFLPVPLGPPVAMDLEESVHYSLDDWSDDEWLSSLPNGQGAYRVVTEDGPMVLTLAAFHQLHCLRMFRKDMVSQTTNLGHSHHCLNYLRQSFLCEADTTLEPKEFFTKNSTHYHNYPTRVCRDWTAFYNVMEDNYREWRHHYALNTSLV